MSNLVRIVMNRLLLVLVATGLHGLSVSAAEKPNFIVINIDDLGYADVGPFGSKLNRTPNLDRMAAEGRKLTCHYAAPVCSPSRAQLMTGCYPKRTLAIPHVLFPNDAVGLSTEEHTVAKLLKAQGYSTMCIGKWHLGDQPEFLPTKHGFDHYLGLPYSNDMGPAEDGVKSDLGAPIPAKKGPGLGQPPLPLMRDEKVLQRVLANDQTTLVKLYTEEALKYIEAKKTEPFFLYFAHNAVHFPLYPGKEFQKKSQNGLYGDWVEEVDWSVGQVLEALRKSGLSEKTLVIFTSDNGGTKRGTNAPLRDFKGSTWEGGMRVPTIAWWPGKIPAGTSTNEITAMMDVLPTFVKLGGGKVPADRKIDGGDIWPLLAGDAGAKSPRESFLFYRGLKLEAVRSGPWKLRLVNGQLFNLDADVAESKDVAAENPEIVKKLQALAEATKDDLGQDGYGPGVRHLGKVQKPEPLIGFDGKVREGFAAP
jgi:arylsulfatase A